MDKDTVKHLENLAEWEARDLLGQAGLSHIEWRRDFQASFLLAFVDAFRMVGVKEPGLFRKLKRIAKQLKTEERPFGTKRKKPALKLKGVERRKEK